MLMSSVERGRIAESLAAGYLALQGYAVLERNFRYSRVEVDLIARRSNLVVFVEVKYRRGRSHGGAVGAVSRKKMRFLETAAAGYLKLHAAEKLSVRFDVVVIEQGEGWGVPLTIRHIQSAFRASGRYR